MAARGPCFASCCVLLAKARASRRSARAHWFSAARARAAARAAQGAPLGQALSPRMRRAARSRSRRAAGLRAIRRGRVERRRRASERAACLLSCVAGGSTCSAALARARGAAMGCRGTLAPLGAARAAPAGGGRAGAAPAGRAGGARGLGAGGPRPPPAGLVAAAAGQVAFVAAAGQLLPRLVSTSMHGGNEEMEIF